MRCLWEQAANGVLFSCRCRHNVCAISAVRSVEPSFTITSSQLSTVCRMIEPIDSSMNFSVLKAGITNDTAGNCFI